jgi:hypothetical protein
MRERRRRHDDAHRPMGGKGKRATPRRVISVRVVEHCPHCGEVLPPWAHLCGWAIDADLPKPENR